MTVVIAGAGLAGTRCAELLRADGYDGRIVVVGDEPHAPYERPALSKEFLAGTRAGDELALRPDSYWEENDIELTLGARVDSVDPRSRGARVNGRELRWDAFVLATGARARRLDRNAHHLRSLDDALALRAVLAAGAEIVVIGAGFVGMEVASTASELGAQVTIVDQARAPLLQQLGPDIGLLLAKRARRRGIDLRLGVAVARIDRHAVELADGDVLRADAIIAGIGAEPADGLLGRGAIATDACGRTRWPNVFACGDIAAWWRPELGKHQRFEHWTSAAGQARAVARTILGDPQPYDELPYFWSDQFGLRLQYVSTGHPWATVELEGDEKAFVASYLRRDRTVAAVLGANRPREIGAVLRALAAARTNAARAAA